MTRDYYGTKRVTAWEQNHTDTGLEGYAIKYGDGYTSWSPRGVFEAAYQPLDKLSFGHALAALKEGKRVCRSGWNGKGLWVELQIPDAMSKMGLPYLFLQNPPDHPLYPDKRVPWLASQTDILADDWQIEGEW